MSNLQNIIGRPARRRLALIGTSHVAGAGASSAYATGFREHLQRELRAAGYNFRMLGRGFGAPDGTGTTWGKFYQVSDYHDTPIAPIGDPRHNGYSGRLSTKTSTVTLVSGNNITAPGHTLSVGTAFTPTSTGAVPGGLTANRIYYAASVSGDVITAALYEGSTSAITLSSTGSGTITLNEGIIEMMPGIGAGWDAAPDALIVDCMTNDIVALIAGGATEAEALAAIQAREALLWPAIDAVAPNALKIRMSVLDFRQGAANQATCSAVALAFNSWLAQTVRGRGRNWAFRDVTSKLGAGDYQSDGVHLNEAGNRIVGTDLASAIIASEQSVSAASISIVERVPRAFTRRAKSACIDLRATTHRATFAAQTGLNSGANSRFTIINFMPMGALAGGTNVIWSHGNPYTEGGMLVQTGAQLRLYSTSTIPVPTTSYTALLQPFRWHQVMTFESVPKQEAAIFLNGQLVQRVVGSAIGTTTDTDGWTVGAYAGLNSMLGLYSDFIVGHGAGLDIEDALQIAQALYFDGKDPLGMTARFRLDENTGTALAGLPGATAGTLSGGSWIAAGLYERPWDIGYQKPTWDRRSTPYTGAATLSYGEHAVGDPTAAGFTFTLPTAVGAGESRIRISNGSASTNTITVDGATTETLDGVETVDMTTAWADIELQSNDVNWIVV